MIIVLLGYMASGKSLVGQKLAISLGYDFVDLDAFIEKQEGMTISELFDLKGEIYFRKKESINLRQLIGSNSNLVLALGGGTPCYSENMDMLIKTSNCTTIFLNASISTLVNRLQNEIIQRPLISHLKSKDELNEFVGKHLFERNPYYKKAEFTINTDNKSVKDIVEQIVFDLF